MRTYHYLATIHLIALATTASLPTSGDAFNALNLLLNRHATGCSHSANWQGGAESSSTRICNNGTNLAIASTDDPLINKTDCQALVQKLSGQAGTGHWDIQWNCDGDTPDVLGSSGACGFSLDDMTQSNENTISPQDVIEFINQAMDMFPNDTMSAVTGSTTCNNVAAQTISWRVGSSSSTSSAAAAVQPRWSWLCLVGTLVVWLSFQRSI